MRRRYKYALGAFVLLAVPMTVYTFTPPKPPEIQSIKHLELKHTDRGNLVIRPTFYYWYKGSHEELKSEIEKEMLSMGWKNTVPGVWQKPMDGVVAISAGKREERNDAPWNRILPEDWGPEYTVVYVSPVSKDWEVRIATIYFDLKSRFFPPPTIEVP